MLGVVLVKISSVVFKTVGLVFNNKESIKLACALIISFC